MTPRDRNPTPEELAVWRQETEGATRLSTPRVEQVKPAAPKMAPRPFRPFRMRETGLRNAASLPPLEADDLTRVDGATAGRLRRGRYPIHARIDLHGMTRAQAFDTVTAGLERAYGDGQRCVLVITGKGGGEGVLRQLLPQWLNDESLRPLLLAFTHAQPQHGGSGAFYVLLRKTA